MEEAPLIPVAPKGERRPADVIGNAVKVMRIATSEEPDDILNDSKDPAAKAYTWIRIHKSLRVTPGIAAGISETVMDWANVVEAMVAEGAAQKRRPYRK